MTEPTRARPRRPVHGIAAGSSSTPSTTFPTPDLAQLVYAYGDSPPHLPTTLSTLDEILTDFIIETCHLAALSASYSRRQKLKVEDFKFVLRHDERLLGRAMEQIWRDKRIKESRKMDGLDATGGGMGGEMAGLEAVALEGGVEVGEMRGKKKGKRGKRKRKDREEEEDVEEGERKRKERGEISDEEEGKRGGKRVAS